MSAEAFLLVLTAAILHAGWNTVVKASDDRLISAWAVTAASGLVSVPVLVVAGPPETVALPMLAMSAAIHIVYVHVLSRAYERADLSVAYPIARGTAPLIVTVVGVGLLDDRVSALGALGVLAITAGLGLLAGGRERAAISWAVVTGLVIASYSIVDGIGVRRGDESLRYIATLNVAYATVLTGIVLWNRGPQRMVSAARAQPGRLLTGGAASAMAYFLVMVAARDEALGLVVGLRETSAVFGFLLGRYLLSEAVTLRQAVAVGMAALGAVFVSFGGG